MSSHPYIYTALKYIYTNSVEQNTTRGKTVKTQTQHLSPTHNIRAISQKKRKDCFFIFKPYATHTHRAYTEQPL